MEDPGGPADGGAAGAPWVEVNEESSVTSCGVTSSPWVIESPKGTGSPVLPVVTRGILATSCGMEGLPREAGSVGVRGTRSEDALGAVTDRILSPSWGMEVPPRGVGFARGLVHTVPWGIMGPAEVGA